MKKKYGPPRKKDTLATRINRDKEIRKIVEDKINQDTKVRIRMGWAYLIAMADTEGVNLTPEQINAVVHTMNDTMEEYYKMRDEDGEEIADSKMYAKICQILGEEGTCDYQYEKIFNPKE